MLSSILFSASLNSYHKKCSQVLYKNSLFLGGSSRKYIEIQPGTYAQTVYIVGKVPLTIYGSGSSPSDVVITLSQPADMTTTTYINQVN